MTDPRKRHALYRQLAADLRRRVVDGREPNASLPAGTFLITATGQNRRTVLRGLRALIYPQQSDPPSTSEGEAGRVGPEIPDR